MSFITEKIWFLAAALCLLGVMSTFVVVVGNHKISGESSTELVDFVDEVETISHRNSNRRKRKKAGNVSWRHIVSTRATQPMVSRFFKPVGEREFFNGTGSYLQI